MSFFQKKACNYKKGMVLFNSSLREKQNSEFVKNAVQKKYIQIGSVYYLSRGKLKAHGKRADEIKI